jgi:diguanylate cyclase (GGDEF)-like protein/PAS domain S-box-containing protein
VEPNLNGTATRAKQRNGAAPPGAPAPGWSSFEELVEEIFEAEHAEHLDAATLDAALMMLLDTFPDAPVGAHTADGVIIAMPESIRLRGNPQLEARSGADLVVPDKALLDGWERAVKIGAARYPVRLVGHPEFQSTVYALDVRETHGVLLVLSVWSVAGAGTDSPDAPPPTERPKPRCATMRTTRNGVITETDEATSAILGWSAEEMVGKRGTDFMHEEDRALAIERWITMTATTGPGPRLRLRYQHSNGTWIWFEVTNHNLLEDPEHSCVVTELVDISEEMAAHELLDGLAQVIPVGLLQFDREKHIAYSNDRLHEILDVVRSETLEEQFATVDAATAPALWAAVRQVLDKGRPADIEVELSLPTRESRFCTVSLRAIAGTGEITGAIACVTDITSSARMREELERRATFDQLTGCYNRAAIMARLEEGLRDRRRADHAVMFLDLDGFKQINDELGHAAGDEVLRLLTLRLREALRTEDMVGRVGGDEFLVVCPNVGGPRAAMTLARRISSLQQAEARIAGRVMPLRASIGVAFVSGDDSSAEKIVAAADRAMYEAKRAGGARPVFAGARAARGKAALKRTPTPRSTRAPRRAKVKPPRA